MKKALCTTNLNNFNLLAEGQIETMDFVFVDRTICEKVENNFFQLIPYISFLHTDFLRGKMDIITYRRPGSGEGESRLQGKTSFGFGGHIDSEEDMVFSSKTEVEGLDTVYHLSQEDIKRTAIKCATREIKEELGVDLNDPEIFDHNNFSFALEREEEPDEVGTVHVCLSLRANLQKKGFMTLLQKAQTQESEVEELNAICVDMGMMAASLNYPAALLHLQASMTKDHQVEEWSFMVCRSLLLSYFQMIHNHWDTEAIMTTVFENAQRKVQEEQMAQDPSSDEGFTAVDSYQDTPASRDIDIAPQSAESVQAVIRHDETPSSEVN